MKAGAKIALICAVSILLLIPVCQAAPGFDSVIKQGMSGDAVFKLQAKLFEYGYLTDEPDGYFGGQTRDAVMHFQFDNGLMADGVAGTNTLAALKDFKPSVITANRSLPDRKALQLVAYSRQYLGVPYVWAGRTPAGFDCSGFVYYLYDRFGVKLPRMADEQFETGVWVNRSDLQPGDLVFFSTYEPGPSHVGIYIGGGQFIHASSGADEVTITPLAKPYYRDRYIGARRVLR